MTAEQQELVAKGKRSLTVARRLMDEGDYDFAVSRAYYAMFYVAKSAIVETGQPLRKHHGVHQIFWEHLVQPGHVAPEIHSALTKAWDERLTSDYDETVTLSHADAQRATEQAEMFLQAVIPRVR